MKPNKDLLLWQKWPHLSAMVNDVSLRLGLPPFSGGEIQLDSDYGVIAQRITLNIQTCLSRGWWFNTRLDYELTSSDWVSNGNYYSVSDFVLKYRPIAQQLNGMPKSIRVVHDIANDGSVGATKLVVDDADWNPDNSFKLDLIVAPVEDFLPHEFAEYIVVKTTNQLANIFNVPVEKDPNLEARAWYELQRADAYAEQPFNIIEDNPLNWLTTRRR